MAISKPTPGNLISKIDEIIDFINGQSSGSPLMIVVGQLVAAACPSSPNMVVPLLKDGREIITTTTSILMTMGAGTSFNSSLEVPTFIGTLILNVAELDITNADGTEQLNVYLANPVALTSGSYTPVFDGGSFCAVGTDLTLNGPQDTVVTTAGGLYQAQLTIGLTWT